MRLQHALLPKQRMLLAADRASPESNLLGGPERWGAGRRDPCSAGESYITNSGLKSRCSRGTTKSSYVSLFRAIIPKPMLIPWSRRSNDCYA